MHIMTQRGWQPLQFVKVTVLPAGQTKTWLEQNNIPVRSCVEHYSKAIHDYIDGHIDHERLLAWMGTK